MGEPQGRNGLPQGPELFQLLVESVSDYAIFALDVHGHIATWNIGAERIKGYTAAEIVGRHFSTFYTPFDQQRGWPAEELERAGSDGRFEDEGWRVRKDGTRFWASVVITALRHEDGRLRGFAKVTRDLTLRRAMEEAERAAREQAEHASRMKDDFLATISHELRTPLNVMIGTIWRIRSGQETDPTAMSRLVDTLDRNVRLLVRLVEDLLDVSRMITGKLRLELQPVELGPVVEAAVEVIEPTARAKGLTVTTNLQPTGPILGDVHRLQQILWNLLSNSVKFTPPGGAVEITQKREGLDVLITVRDSGRGIAPEFLPRAFEQFSQYEDSRTRSYGGLGLGLAVVKHLVEAHGGKVTAESAGQDQGSIFRLRFPVPALTVPLHTVAPALQVGDPLPDLRDVKVLVVDDQPDARESVHAVLTYCGAHVRSVGSAAEAMDALASFRPHVLLADIAMPGADGFELIERVRRDLPPDISGIPAGALTAYSSTDTRLRILAAGYQLHLAKPIEPYELTEAVAQLALKVHRIKRDQPEPD